MVEAGGYCVICHRGDRGAIEGAMADGVPYYAISQQYRLSQTTIAVHHTGHMEGGVGGVGELIPMAARYPELAGSGKGVSAVGEWDSEAEARMLYFRTLSVMDDADAAGDSRLVAMLLREAKLSVDQVNRLTAPVAVVAGYDFYQLPEYLALRSRLIVALQAYPEARAAVIAAFTPPHPSKVGE